MNTNIKKLTIASALALVIGVTNSYGTEEVVVGVPLEVNEGATLLITKNKTVRVNQKVTLRGNGKMTGQAANDDLIGTTDADLVSTAPVLDLSTASGEIVGISEFEDETSTLLASEPQGPYNGIVGISAAYAIGNVPFVHYQLEPSDDGQKAKIYVDTEDFATFYGTFADDNAKTAAIIDTVIKNSGYQEKNLLEASNYGRFLDIVGDTGTATEIKTSFGDKQYVQAANDALFSLRIENKVKLSGIANKNYKNGEVLLAESSELTFATDDAFPEANITLETPEGVDTGVVTLNFEGEINTRLDGLTTPQTIDIHLGTGTKTLSTSNVATSLLKLNAGGKLIL